MALLWKLKNNSSTSASVMVQSDTTGTVKITANGADFPASAATGTKDGIVLIDVTGLTGDTSFDLYFDDVLQDSGTLKIAPTDDSIFCIGWFSCMYQNQQKDAVGLAQLAHEPNLQYVFDQGDTSYTASAINAFGVTAKDLGLVLSEAQDIAEYHDHHRAMMVWPSFQLLGHTVPYFDGADDHEWPGDNWDHSIANAPATATTQAQVDDIFAAGYEGFRDYATGNPVNNDSDAIAQKPPASADADATRYPVSYWRKQITKYVEVFHLDYQTHRASIAGDVDILGSTQEAHLLAHLASSTAIFKVIDSSKQILEPGSSNTDGWIGAATQLARILAAIDAASGWAVPGGVLWIAGDNHVFCITQSSIASCVCACSLSQDIKAAGARTINANTQELLLGGQNNYGLLEFHGGDYVDVFGKSIMGKNIVEPRRLLPGSNLLVRHSSL